MRYRITLDESVLPLFVRHQTIRQKYSFWTGRGGKGWTVQRLFGWYAFVLLQKTSAYIPIRRCIQKLKHPSRRLVVTTIILLTLNKQSYQSVGYKTSFGSFLRHSSAVSLIMRRRGQYLKRIEALLSASKFAQGLERLSNGSTKTGLTSYGRFQDKIPWPM